MSDGRRTGGADGWPPVVPSTIHLRPRSAAGRSDGAIPAIPAVQAPAVELPAVPAVEVPAVQAPAVEVPPGSSALSIPASPPGPAAPADLAPREESIAHPVGYRLRLVRDAAAALMLLTGAVLVVSLVAGPRPEGAVLSATSAPADPRGAPAMHLPESVPSAAGSSPSPQGAAASPTQTPAGSGQPVASAPSATDDAAP